MIVLKATQDKVLAALQSVAGIVERRHTLPILANVLIRNCKIYGFIVAGINVAPSAGGGTVVVDEVVLMTNDIGVNVNSSNGSVNVDVRNSTLYNNVSANVEVQASTGTHGGAVIENSTLAYSAAGSGLLMNGSAAVAVLSADTIAGNGTGVKITAGTVFTLKNNALAGNTTDLVGTLTLYGSGLQ